MFGKSGAGYQAGPRARDCLVLPRLLRLLWAIASNLIESIGLPMGALALAAWLYGRDAGLLASVAATWLIALIRKITTGSVPGLLTISAVILTVQTVMVVVTDQLWLYLLQFPVASLVTSALFARSARGPAPLVARIAAEMFALRSHHPGLDHFFRAVTWLWACIFFLKSAGLTVLMLTQSLRAFIMLSSLLTSVMTLAGVSVSAWWFRSVLRRLGLRLRFTRT